MKQIRLDFSGGLNIIADKSVLPDKFGTVMDNIDLRSGFPRCFREPIFNQVVSGSTTKKIFNFRGRWLYSDNWRDYVADYINGIERIYWTESINSVEYSGSDDLAPQKMIEGTTVPLGTARPASAPIVSQGKNIVPRMQPAVLQDGGTLTEGTYYYAVSAEFVKGVTAPSDMVNVVVAQNQTKSVILNWTAVEDAVAYIIWGRANSYSAMKRIQKVNSSTLTFTDNGSVTPKGDSPNDYFDDTPVTYVYSYERDVNNVFNESGISEVSDRIKTSSGRNVARDVLNDGYFSQDTTVDISTDDGYSFTVEPRPSTVDTFPYYVPIEVVSAVYDDYLEQVVFTTLTAHKLTTDDEIVFTGSSWLNPSYNNKKYPVIVINTTTFAIKNIPAPNDEFQGRLITSGISFTPIGNGIMSDGNYNLISETGVGYGGVLYLTFVNPPGPLISVLDTATVSNGGVGYKVGDLVYVELEPVPTPAIPSPIVTEEIEPGTGSTTIVSSGSNYPKPSSIKTLDFVSAGSGYTAGTYTSVSLSGGTGSGATINVKVNSDGLSYDVSLVNGGSGYVIGDTLTATFSGTGSGFSVKVADINYGTYDNVEITGGSGTGAKATVTVNSSGQIAQVNVTDGGSGYTTADTGLSVSGLQSGSGASLNVFATTSIKEKQYFNITAIEGNNEISICRSRITISPVPSEGTINNGDVMYLNMSDSDTGRIGTYQYQTGSGFKDGLYSDITLLGGSGSEAKANIKVTGGKVSSVDIEDEGTGYVVNNVLTVNVNNLESDHSINAVTITNGGSGYVQGSYPNVPLILNSKTITNITQAGAAVVTSASHGFLAGRQVQFSGITTMVQLNGQTATITSATTNTFTININTTSYTAFGAGTGYVKGTGNSATATITVASSGVVSSILINNNGKGYYASDTFSASNTNLGGSGSGLIITVDSVYIGSGFSLTVTSILAARTINGLYKVYTNDLDGNPIASGSFDINEYIGDWEAPVEMGASAKWVPYNGYYKTWNLYRTGVAGSFQLVEKIPISTTNYLDVISTEYLGVPPTSYYTDTGIFGSQQIDFNTPPLGLQSLTNHYGMLFGVDGQRVKWTPIGQPDAWPDVYYYDFAYKPLALASFGTALIVLCEDAIYRIDGNQPSSMSLSKTNANDGCIAPYSVQKTNNGLAYLSKRGVMLFDGMNAQCITDNRIPSNMLLGPSKLLYPVNFWWMPTKLGYFYGNFAHNDGVYYPDESSNRFYQTNPIPSAIYDIKSFYHNGRYFLVYVKSDYYSAHTTICIDLQVEGFPITTLGMKPIDVIVNELDDVYMLVDNQGNGSLANLSTFKQQNSEAEPFVASETYTIPVASEIRRPSIYTPLTGSLPTFSDTNTALAYDLDLNHTTTNGLFDLSGNLSSDSASFKFSSFQAKAQTWTSATLNISRNYTAIVGAVANVKFYLSTDGGSNWGSVLLTDDYDNDPATPSIFSYTLPTPNPSSLSNYQVKVEMYAERTTGLRGAYSVILQLYDIWIEGVSSTSPSQITVNNSDTYVSNISVYNSTDGIPMVEVTSSPSANEYSVSNGVYTFNPSSVGKQIIIDYRFRFATNTGLSIWKLFYGKGNIPLVIRSGQKGFGNTTERRKYEHIEFYGNGTLFSRCYIDNNWIADDIVSLTELPSKARKFNLPKGKRTGYNLDFEAYGDTNRLVVEYSYSEMGSPS